MLPIDDLRDLRVLVTGASSGIGAATARVLATCGANVALNYNSGRQAAEQLATEITSDGGSAITVGGDISNPVGAETVVKLAAEKLGGLDCLINNAGAVERTPTTTADDDLVDRMIDVNMRSILWTVSAATPHLLCSERASIINVGSIAGRNGGSAGSGVYAAAKAAVHSLTRSMAKELAAQGVRVNAIAPGVIHTPFHDATPSETLRAMQQTIPMGRLGTAEDCAWAFIFLASPSMSGYITGQILDINGGQFMP